MEKKLDGIAKKLGSAIRKAFWDKKMFENNIQIEIKVGRYLINFERMNGKNEVLTEFPEGLIEIIMDYISEMNELWMEEPNDTEMLGDDTTKEYDIFIIIDGDPIELKDTTEIQRLIKKTLLEKDYAVENEDYEKAARLRDKIQKYNTMIENV